MLEYPRMVISNIPRSSTTLNRQLFGYHAVHIKNLTLDTDTSHSDAIMTNSDSLRVNGH
jgi:hypothetical protein